MAKLEITGGKKLSGKIKIAGNKNSVLPIMAAALLSSETSTIENVPQILDVEVMTQLLKLCGAKISRTGDKVTINPATITETEFPRNLTTKLRASIVLLGAILSRLGKIKMGYPGGDIIGRRSLDAHVQALESLGAKIEIENDEIIASVTRLKGKEIFMHEASVTATENVLIAASMAEGTTVIKRAATEPHVIDLCMFLVKMGADISGIGTSTITVNGVTKLFGANHVVRPDHIEVGTFAILAAISSKKIEMEPVIKDDLDMILMSLNNFGVDYNLYGNRLVVNGSKLKSVEKVVTDVWPGFPTDLMAPMIVLATQAEGMTIMHDWMYESRMFFVDKLLSMGAKVEIADVHRVFVYGPSKLHAQRLDTPDIRAGIALVIAALIAKGKSTIERPELIERGYENIVERLTALGASIKKVS